MSKSQMRLANRAWRAETKAIGWDKGWTKGRKAWKSFCRENARITVWQRTGKADKTHWILFLKDSE